MAHSPCVALLTAIHKNRVLGYFWAISVGEWAGREQILGNLQRCSANSCHSSVFIPEQCQALGGVDAGCLSLHITDTMASLSSLFVLLTVLYCTCQPSSSSADRGEGHGLLCVMFKCVVNVYDRKEICQNVCLPWLGVHLCPPWVPLSNFSAK